MYRVRARAVAGPHSSNPATLQAERQVYRRGLTPVRDRDGTVRALNVRPAGPETAGRHLDQIADRYGEPGLARSIHGLTVTRGWSFAQVAVRHASASVQRHGTARAVAACIDPAALIGEQSVFPAAAMRQSRGVGVPSQVRLGLPPAVGHSLGNIRIHDDPSAHAVARAIGARAVTVGKSIYMGAGEYQPSTPAGRRLLAHEIAHTIQQAGATVPSAEQMRVSCPGDTEEVEADSFADAVTADAIDVPMPRRSTASTAKLLRAITFEPYARNPTTIKPGTGPPDPATGTFDIGLGNPKEPHFSWTAAAIIHGNAGDPFANFEVGPLQVLRSYWFNAYWGTGANRTELKITIPTPIRDALTAGDTWYADVLASSRFRADRDARGTSLNDSPGVSKVPIANPIAGRVSTPGWFTFAASFISYFSALDTKKHNPADAFWHLAHVYWSLSVVGNLDTTRPVDRQVLVLGATINASEVSSGVSKNDPPIIGGDIAKDAATFINP